MPVVCKRITNDILYTNNTKTSNNTKTYGVLPVDRMFVLSVYGLCVCNGLMYVRICVYLPSPNSIVLKKNFNFLGSSETAVAM